MQKMEQRQFEPTHRMCIGTGKNKTYLYVQIVSDAGKKDGELHYNVIVAPDNKSGIHSIPAIPKSCLEALNEDQPVISANKKKKKEKLQGDLEEQREEQYILKYMKEEEDWLTIREAANAFHVPGITLRHWILKGELESMILPRGKFQNSYLIKRSLIKAILEKKSKDSNG